MYIHNYILGIYVCSYVVTYGTRGETNYIIMIITYKQMDILRATMLLDLPKPDIMMQELKSNL